MRTVKFYSTQNNAFNSYESDAVTFGEFMDEVNAEVSISMRYWDKDSRNSFEHRDGLLPSGDFTLVASPRNNKAAMATVREALQSFTEDFQDILAKLQDDLDDTDNQEFPEDLSPEDEDEINEIEDLQDDFIN